MYLQYECKEPVSLYPALQWWNQPKIGAEWLFGGTGVGASNHFEAGGFIRSREEFAWPNIQYHFLPVAINYNGSNAVKEHGFQCHVGSMRSPSRGHVRLNPATRTQHPAILFNYMSHEQDWQEFRDAIRITRDHPSTRAGSVSWPRNQPGVECQTDEQLDEFVRNHAETAFHPCGPCKMGYDEMSVVGGEGRVHGLRRPGAGDASIMPQILAGNLNATTIMIGEK
ncbi:GMC oxidoreductase [Escherichia coli]